MDRWRSVLPGESSGNQRNTYLHNQPNHTTTTTPSRLPSRLYYDRKQLHRNTLLLQPSNDPNAATFSSTQTHIGTYLTSKPPSTSKLFGEPLCQKAPHEYRIISNNIGCIGVDAVVNSKQQSLKDWLVQYEVDLVGWQEIGLAQHMIQKHERLAERMRDYRRKQIRISSSNNRHESIDKFQWGGTAVIAFDTLANMTRASGADETGLGRWSWLQLEGHNNHRIRVISAYNPCRTSTKQFATVYAQHKRYFLSKYKDVCPRQQFRIDLCNQCKKWIDNGELIILLIDCNENLNEMKDLQTHLTSEPISLIDPIRYKYPISGPFPPTTSTGSYPIDSIFVSPQLNDIVRGGWLEIGVGYSDHRILYFDIDMFKFLGKHKNSTAVKKIRRLQCNDPRTVHAFNDRLEKQYQYHNVHATLQKLDSEITTPPSPEQIRTLQRLDSINTQLIINAEKKCRKLRMGAKPYTPETAKLGLTIEFWRSLIKKLEGHNISSSYLRRTARKCNVFDYKKLSLEECKRARAKAHRAYKDYVVQADRPSFIDGLADAIAAEGDIERSTVVRQLKSLEETRHTHRLIRNSTKDFDGAPYHMELPNSQGSFISTDKEEIERALIVEYEAKYHLAEASPFLQEPLLSEFGPLALNENAERVLQGTYECPPHTNKYVQCFIKHLERDKFVKAHPNNETIISTSQLNTFWNRMDEKIVSSPSGRHIGTYKATSRHNKNSEIQARLTSLPFELGIPLPRTTQCINVSLQKKGKGIKPSDLRTIWLLEADFNSAAKIHWVSRMMNGTAITNKLIPDSQYAKRGSRAIEAALVKVLFFDHIRQNKKPGIIIASDLMQCFDRMAHPVCSLVSRRLGVPIPVIQCMLLSIQQMTHRVRTGYGDSTFTYGNNKTNPLQGGGQGNGASLPLWLAISCILISMMEDRVMGVRLQTAITLQVLMYIAIMYVDDTDILLSDVTGFDSLDDVFYRALRAARTWEEAVLISGGAVRPEKCYWSAIDFRWKNGNWSYMPMHEFDGEIWFKDTNGNPKLIERFDVDRSKDGLGIHINPDGSMHSQVEYIGAKITKWVTKLKHGSLSRHHSYIAANTTIFRTITYSLPASSLSIEECRRLENILYTVLMPKMGLSHKLPLPYRYGTLSYQGMGLLHIHSEQMIGQLKVFLEHISRDSQLGISYRATLETLQLELGSIHDVFSLPYHKYHFLATYTWIKDLWFSVDKYGISLRKPKSLFEIQRDNDCSLMDAVIISKKFTNNELRRINLCRIYLRVFYLSDICSGNGRGVMHNYVSGLRTQQRRSQWVWPRQQRPPAKDWKLWNTAIREVWSKSETHLLAIPLGQWHRLPHQQFQFYYDPKILSVVEMKKDSIDVYGRTQGKTRNCAIYQYRYTIYRSKARWMPIIAEHLDFDRIIAEPMMDTITFTMQPSIESLSQFVAHKYPHYAELMSYAKFPKHGFMIASMIAHKKAISVTDASVSQLTQTAAVSWIITDRFSDMVGEGVAGCPTLYHDCDSYGSELFGIYCILVMVKIAIEYHDIESGSLTIACDNDASLLAGTAAVPETKIDPKYFDLIWEASDILRSLPITVKKKYVKGHAEDFKLYLNKYERLNILMDRRAKKFRSELETGTVHHSPIHLGQKYYSVWVNDRRICSKIEYNIKDHIHGGALRRKLVEKGDVTATGINYIDWNAIGAAGKSLTASERLWVAKFTSGFCGTASQLHFRYLGKVQQNEKKMKEDKQSSEETKSPDDGIEKCIQLEEKLSQWTTDLCPLCSDTRENTKHVVQCHHTSAVQFRKNQFLLFADWLSTQRSDQCFRDCISLVLQSDLRTSFTTAMKQFTSSPLHIQAAAEQDEIGGVNFLFGRVSKKWREVQRRHYCHYFPSKNYSADAWIRRLIAKIYRTTQSIWKFRCEFVHGVENVLTSKREKKALEKEIRKQFNLGPNGVRGNDRQLFNNGMAHILTVSVREQKYWVRTIQLSRAYVKEAEQNMFIGMRNVMKKWAKPPD